MSMPPEGVRTMPILDRPSVQLYTLRDVLVTDLPGTVERLAEIGYRQVEPFALLDYAERLEPALASSGLAAPTTHAHLVGRDADAVFEAAGRVGIGTVIEPMTDRDRWTTRDGVAAVADEMNALAERAATFGLRVGYHNHAFELSTRIGERSALEVFAEFLAPTVLLEVDTYWAAVGGEDPVSLVSRLGDRVRFLHIKDGPVTAVTRDQVAVGAGAMPVADVVAAASALEVGVVELDDTAGDVWTAVVDSYRFLTEERDMARAGGMA